MKIDFICRSLFSAVILVSISARAEKPNSSVAALVEALSSPENKVRAKAASVLSQLKSSSEISELSKTLQKVKECPGNCHDPRQLYNIVLVLKNLALASLKDSPSPQIISERIKLASNFSASYIESLELADSSNSLNFFGWKSEELTALCDHYCDPYNNGEMFEAACPVDSSAECRSRFEKVKYRPKPAIQGPTAAELKNFAEQSLREIYAIALSKLKDHAFVSRLLPRVPLVCNDWGGSVFGGQRLIYFDKDHKIVSADPGSQNFQDLVQQFVVIPDQYTRQAMTKAQQKLYPTGIGFGLTFTQPHGKSGGQKQEARMFYFQPYLGADESVFSVVGPFPSLSESSARIKMSPALGKIITRARTISNNGGVLTDAECYLLKAVLSPDKLMTEEVDELL
jgi:hypothetical protein